MAKSTLPVDFTDDILNESMSGKRRYRLIYNDDGTVSLEDVTAYDQIGSNFGSKQVNETNEAVNASADAGKIIDSLATVRAVTKEGYIAGALALKELDISLQISQSDIVIDSNNLYTTSENSNSRIIVFKYGRIINFNGRLCVKAEMLKGTWYKIGTLPEGYRPIRNIITNIGFDSKNGGFLEGSIGTDGSIQIRPHMQSVATDSWIVLSNSCVGVV